MLISLCQKDWTVVQSFFCISDGEVKITGIDTFHL